jgi:hypothetical protein
MCVYVSEILFINCTGCALHNYYTPIRSVSAKEKEHASFRDTGNIFSLFAKA